MLTKRIIPCLDVKKGKVVKGVKFKNHRLIGDPIKLAKKYSIKITKETETGFLIPNEKSVDSYALLKTLKSFHAIASFRGVRVNFDVDPF